jgi:lipoate-protein ligase A
LNQPVLRFYGWLEAAATFGYSQKYDEIARATHLRPLVRRPTGGGLVPHAADWTYSLIFPPGHCWYELKAVDSYRQLHEWVRAGFARAGVVTELSAGTAKELPNQCFVGSDQFDLLWGGQKIAGAAQRRTRTGLLIQGSVQPTNLPVRKTDWQKALCDAAHAQWKVKWQACEMDFSQEERVERLAREKYSQRSYNQRR